MLSNLGRTAAAGGVLNRVAAITGGSSSFITRSGTKLYLAGSAQRFSGVNMYWVGLDDNPPGSSGSPQYPTHYMIDNGFAAAQTLGAGIARTHTVGISVGYSFSILQSLDGSNNPVFNDAAFEPIDYAVQSAANHGVKLMVPLCDNWRYFHGGKWNFVHFRAGQTGDSGTAIMDTKSDLSRNTANDYTGAGNEQDAENQFFYESLIISDFKKYISHILNHVNQYTGIALKNDPTIAIWETGNEIYKAANYPAWTATIANYIKSLAPNQLVADGSCASGLATSQAPGLNVANVDIVGGHYYTQSNSLDSLSSQLAADVQTAYSAGKAFFVGEYPWSNAGSDNFRAAIEANNAISNDMFWSVLPYISSGNPQSHGNGYGGDDAPLHVPGANSTEVTGVSTITTHISTVTAAAPGGPPAPPPNILRSATVATSNAPVASYTAASSGSVPTLAIDSTTAADGSTSLRVTATGTGYPYVYLTNLSDAAQVTAGSTYTATVAAKQGNGSVTSASAHITWFDSSGSYLSGNDGGAIGLSTGSFTLLTATATAPATAAYAVPQFQTPVQTATGDIVYLDEWGIFAGSSVSSWSSP